MSTTKSIFTKTIAGVLFAGFSFGFSANASPLQLETICRSVPVDSGFGIEVSIYDAMGSGLKLLKSQLSSLDGMFSPVFQTAAPIYSETGRIVSYTGKGYQLEINREADLNAIPPQYKAIFVLKTENNNQKFQMYCTGRN
jgi:hypothetical protein